MPYISREGSGSHKTGRDKVRSDFLDPPPPPPEGYIRSRINSFEEHPCLQMGMMYLHFLSPSVTPIPPLARGGFLYIFIYSLRKC
jgi:hypothetical protein